jgi:hypothetical protein
MKFSVKRKKEKSIKKMFSKLSLLIDGKIVLVPQYQFLRICDASHLWYFMYASIFRYYFSYFSTVFKNSKFYGLEKLKF